jgi:hypothetical protein
MSRIISPKTHDRWAIDLMSQTFAIHGEEYEYDGDHPELPYTDLPELIRALCEVAVEGGCEGVCHRPTAGSGWVWRVREGGYTDD